MWTKIAHNIIKYRLSLLIILVIVTVFMGYHASKVEMSYDFANTVPDDDPDMIELKEFRALFGDDGNFVAIGLRDSAIFEIENFRKFQALALSIFQMDGITDAIGLPILKRLEKDTAETRFVLRDIFPKNIPGTQEDLDSMLRVAFDQKFYAGQIINEDNGALLMLATISKDILNTKNRIGLTDAIIEEGKQFTKETGIDLHYSGLPIIRSVIAGQVANEMKLFLFLSVLVTGLILLLLFRSWTAVVFPMIIIAVVVLWVLGTLALLDYKITILTGLIPPVIVVIGIPNSVYLLNKYHQEYLHHGNKMMAISRVVRKIGIVTLITNFTTAIGFLVLITTDIVILQEFGVVAGINIMATFLVSMILIPGVFSWMPPPSGKQLRHLKLRPFDKVLTLLDLLVHRHRIYIYVVTAIVVVISLFGMNKLQSISYIVDDIPEKSRIKQDLDFFEANFSGIMPLEVIVNTGVKRGVLQARTLEQIDEFEQFLDSLEHISKPVSIVSLIKASKQAFYNNNPERYSLPNNRERGYILRYMRSQSDSSEILNSFVDSTSQTMRISLHVADIGSIKMEALINDVIQPEIDSHFEDSGLDLVVTGTSPLFVKGNKFLVQNLRFSLLLAFLIISVIMGLLFSNFRMILISMIPNFVPLIITAGFMGYMGIPLKPSTALIFSIAFGISVDDSIHFLSKYRQELFANRFFVPVAVSKSLRETGMSMIYTSVILFAGFVIFAWSDFGGTVALGILTSITLLIAMFTNLIVLPALLLTFDSGKYSLAKKKLIDQFEDRFYREDEDEEINLNRIKLVDPENGQPQEPKGPYNNPDFRNSENT